MAEKKKIKEKAKEAVRNLYKRNPFAEKLSDKETYYRAVDRKAFEDYEKNKVVRGSVYSENWKEGDGRYGKGSNVVIPEKKAGKINLDRGNISSRATPFPAFNKGELLKKYLPENGYVFTSQRPMVAKGEINPVTKLVQDGGGHFAHRPYDPFTGATQTSMDASEVRAFYGKPHPIMGYKEVGKGYPAVQAAKEAVKRTAKGIAKGAGSAAAAGVAAAAVEPFAEELMQRYEKAFGVSKPDPKSVAGRLRSLAVGGGPLAAPYEVGKAATELTTELIPAAVRLAYERIIESPARGERIKKATKEREREKRKPVKNQPKIKKGDK